GGGDEGRGPCPIPWPGASTAAGDANGHASGGASDAGGPERSDDFELLTREATPEVGYAELERVAAGEMERLQREYAAESALPVATRALATLEDYLSSETTPENRRELGGFVPRVLRETLAAGDWRAARNALAMLRACDGESATARLFEGLSAEPSAGPMRRL